MQVKLEKPALERFISDQVKAGRFPTPEAVVEDALLRMMDEDVALTPEDLEAIRESDEQIARGEGIPLDDFARRIRQKYGIN